MVTFNWPYDDCSSEFVAIRDMVSRVDCYISQKKCKNLYKNSVNNFSVGDPISLIGISNCEPTRIGIQVNCLNQCHASLCNIFQKSVSTVYLSAVQTKRNQVDLIDRALPRPRSANVGAVPTKIKETFQLL